MKRPDVSVPDVWKNVTTLCSMYNISEDELRSAMNVSPATFKRRKNDFRQLRYDELELIAEKLHTTVQNLIGKPENLFVGRDKK